MGRRGRASGRTLDRQIEKAVGRAMAGTAGNMSAAPRRYGLAEAINRATGGALGMDGTFGMEYMPRDPRDDVPFGPSSPLNPAPLDPARKDTGRPEPRLNEYPVAWNLPGNENVPIPWATLRGAADSVDIMRRCIEVRKEQLAGLDWSFTLDDQVVQGMYAASDGSRGRSDIEADMHRRLLPEIERLTALWRNPWPSNGVSFEQWVAGVMEDHLVLDGVAVYPRVTYGGQVTAFELIDASTIKLLIDYRGARPEHPYAAFQQILYGYPRAEFSQCAYTVKDADGTERTVVEPGLSADQLYYFRENFRTFTPYGFSAVAQSLISARLYLKRQGWMLAEYEDGSTPVTWLVPDGKDGNLTEKLTFRTRRQWEDSINAEYGGQTRQRHRIKVGMPGYTPVQMTSVDERYKPEYDRHLITMLAGHFGVTSTGLGFSESGGFGNSGLHEGQENVQDKASTKPDTRMIERVINDLSRKYLDMPPELRFKFVHADAEDATEQDNAADAQRARGTLTLNDDRKRIGKSPYDFPEADMPMVKVGDGWAPIEGMAERAEQKAEAEQALVDDQLANSEAAREMDAAAAGEEEDVEKSLELVALSRWRNKRRKQGGAVRRAFICKALTPGDFKAGVPADVEFAWWEYVPDALPDEATDIQIAKFVGAADDMIVKGLGRGNDNWRTLARDHKGRWVARGSMRVDALGPASPDKPVLAGLKRDAERRRAASSGQLPAKSPSSTVGGMTSNDSGELAAARAASRAAAERMHAANEAYRNNRNEQAQREVIDAGEAMATARRRLVAAERAEREATGVDSVDTSPARARRGEGYISEGDRMADENREQAAAPKRFGRRGTALRSDADLVRDIEDMGRDVAGGYVPLARFRDRMGGTREEQDAALKRLDRARVIILDPDPNRKAIPPEGHEAAISIGGEPKHRVSVLDGLPSESGSPSRGQRAAALNENMRGALAGDAPAPGSMGERIQRRQEQAVRDTYAEMTAANGGNPPTLDALRTRLERNHGLDRGQQDIVLARLGDEISPVRENDEQREIAEATAALDAAEAKWQAEARKLDDLIEDESLSEADYVAAVDRQKVHVAAAAERVREASAALGRAERPANERKREAQGRAMHDAVVAANEARERAAAESVARQERERQQRELAAAMAEQAAAERRAMFISRTQDGYASLLGGRASVMGHKPSRDLVESMKAQDWKLVGMEGSTSKWEAPDGRKVELITQPGGKVAARGGELGDGIHTMKAVTEYVRNRPATAQTSVADVVNPGPGVSPDAPVAPRRPDLTSPRVAQARYDALSRLTRDQFKALPEAERQQALDDLETIGRVEPWRVTGRGQYGTRYSGVSSVPMNARTLRGTFLMPDAPAKPDPVSSRVDAILASTNEYDTFGADLKGATREEMTAIGETLGVPFPTGYKLGYAREEFGRALRDAKRAGKLRGMGAR